MNDEKVRLAEKRLGLSFNDQDLLRQALTHRSFSYETAGKRSLSNERLEFLGDAILSLVISEFIFRRFPKLEEGKMAKLRAALVNADVLADLAQRLGLGECLFLGKGAEKERSMEKVSILSDAFEALIAAIYLDLGAEKARQFIIETFKPVIIEFTSSMAGFDPKTTLQETSVRLFSKSPLYGVVSEAGPFHQRIYKVKVYIGRTLYGSGEGSSKKRAEQAAAEQALAKLKSKNSD